jgi:hypothetical protein
MDFQPTPEQEWEAQQAYLTAVDVLALTVRQRIGELVGELQMRAIDPDCQLGAADWLQYATEDEITALNAHVASERARIFGLR